MWGLWHNYRLPPLKSGCRNTGWVHEGNPPFRVIASEHARALPPVGGCEPKIYDGKEATVTVEEWMVPPRD
jgi:hypothetical protein